MGELIWAAERRLAAARDQLVAFVDVLRPEREQLREQYARMNAAPEP